MEPDLAAFLARHTPRAEETEVWGASPLRIVSYLAGELPPPGYITSVRGLVFRDDAFLVTHNRDGTHGLPGGRREPGETLEETLRREVLEETGWTLAGPRLLGFMHLQHLGPRPPGHRYPYPDFVQPVYLADAAAFLPDAVLANEYEIGSAFLAIGEAGTFGLRAAERLFLDAALKLRAGRAAP